MAHVSEGLGLGGMTLSAAVVLMALVLFGGTAYKNVAVRNALAAELDRLTPRVTSVTEREQHNRDLREKLVNLEGSSRSHVLKYLQEVTQLVPETAYLTTFRYKGDRIEMDGIATEASSLIATLESSPFFQNVEFNAPTTKYLANQERFSLRMGLEK